VVSFTAAYLLGGFAVFLELVVVVVEVRHLVLHALALALKVRL